MLRRRSGRTDAVVQVRGGRCHDAGEAGQMTWVWKWRWRWRAVGLDMGVEVEVAGQCRAWCRSGAKELGLAAVWRQAEPAT